jgi:hypothetical protein
MKTGGLTLVFGVVNDAYPRAHSPGPLPAPLGLRGGARGVRMGSDRRIRPFGMMRLAGIASEFIRSLRDGGRHVFLPRTYHSGVGGGSKR